jgi:hypothetical protein
MQTACTRLQRDPSSINAIRCCKALPRCPEEELSMKRKLIVLMTAGLLVLSATAAAASPSPPTNGGNGAGQSGQCTGPAADRPASCQSP